MIELQNGFLTQPRRLAAGFAAGITEALIIVTPFEVVKIRLQQQRGLDHSQMKYQVLIFSYASQSCIIHRGKNISAKVHPKSKTCQTSQRKMQAYCHILVAIVLYTTLVLLLLLYKSSMLAESSIRGTNSKCCYMALGDSTGQFRQRALHSFLLSGKNVKHPNLYYTQDILNLTRFTSTKSSHLKAPKTILRTSS